MYETHSEYNILNLQKIKVKLTFIMADIIANTKTKFWYWDQIKEYYFLTLPVADGSVSLSITLFETEISQQLFNGLPWHVVELRGWSPLTLLVPTVPLVPPWVWHVWPSIGWIPSKFATVNQSLQRIHFNSFGDPSIIHSAHSSGQTSPVT